MHFEDSSISEPQSQTERVKPLLKPIPTPTLPDPSPTKPTALHSTIFPSTKFSMPSNQLSTHNLIYRTDPSHTDNFPPLLPQDSNLKPLHRQLNRLNMEKRKCYEQIRNKWIQIIDPSFKPPKPKLKFRIPVSNMKNAKINEKDKDEKEKESQREKGEGVMEKGVVGKSKGLSRNKSEVSHISTSPPFKKKSDQVDSLVDLNSNANFMGRGEFHPPSYSMKTCTVKIKPRTSLTQREEKEAETEPPPRKINLKHFTQTLEQ